MYKIILLLCCFSCTMADAQLRVWHEKTPDGEYEFFCENRDFCNYTLEIEFTRLENLQSLGELPYRGVVRPGRNLLFRLSKIRKKEGISLNYKTHFAKGCINPKVNPDFVYLLPVKPGTQTQAHEMESIKSKLTDEPEPRDYYVARFKMHPGDTVYAVRRGIVTAIRDTTELQDSGYTFSRSDNFIEIYHNDCSFAEYNVFRAGAIFVQPGQNVEGGDPIGIAGGDKYAAGPQVRLSVHFNIDKPNVATGMPGRKHEHAYVPMKFWTRETQAPVKLQPRQNYTSEYPVNIITQEMSNKEARNWKEKHHV